MIRNSTNQISIKPKVSPKTKLSVGVLCLLILLGVVYLSYQLGLRSGNERLGQDATLIKQMSSNISDLQSKVDAAEEKSVFAERQQQIQAEAYKQMSDAYASAEQKNSYLGSRLDFYRSIISPEGGQSGPAIQAIDIHKDEAKIAFDVTLVQAIKHMVHVSGNVTAELYIDDRLLDTWPETGSRGVNYQYFQQVSGEFDPILSTEIDLENARVLIKLSLQDGTLVERSFTIDPEQLNI